MTTYTSAKFKNQLYFNVYFRIVLISHFQTARYVMKVEIVSMQTTLMLEAFNIQVSFLEFHQKYCRLFLFESLKQKLTYQKTFRFYLILSGVSFNSRRPLNASFYPTVAPHICTEQRHLDQNLSISIGASKKTFGSIRKRTLVPYFLPNHCSERPI